MQIPNCPKCGSMMVQRMAGKGSHKGKVFYGCSKYPLCKSIVNIPENEQPVKSDPNVEPPSIEPVNSTNDHTHPRTPLTEKQKYVLSKLRDQLLNVSTNNRSVRLNHIYDIWAFDLHSLISLYGSEYVNDIIESALQRKPSVKIIPLNSKEKECTRISNHLTKLFRNVKEIEVEKGLYDLNIGFPFLCGLTKEGKVIQAPILLMPARLEKQFPQRGAPFWVITQEKGIPVTFNKTLLLALAKYNMNTVNSAIYEMEIPEELHGKQSFMDWVCSTLNANGIPCDLSLDAHDADIDMLPEFNIEDLPSGFAPGILTIHQCAVLGHFPQANSSILKDYENFLNSSQEEIANLLPIIDTNLDEKDETNRTFVADSENSPDEDESGVPCCLDEVPEKENVFLLPADGSQEKIVLSLYDKKVPGIVIWGPPGTGKSQTIVNLIGHALGKEMTCLVVCQKRAALDVVYERLDALGLSKYTAVVHDSRKDRKDLYQKLEEHTIPKDDGIPGQHSYEELANTVEGQTKDLNNVYKTLYDKSPRKVAPIDLYRQSRGAISTALSLPDNCANLDANTLKQLLADLDKYQKVARTLEPNHPWNTRKSFHALGPLDMKSVAACIGQLLNDEKDMLRNMCIIREHANWQKAISLNLEYLPESQSEFVHLLIAHSSKKSFLRFFTVLFWKRHFAVRSACTSAQEYLKRFSETVDSALTKFVKDDRLAEMSDSIMSAKNITGELLKLHDSLLQDFDKLVASDRLYSTAAEATKACIDSLCALFFTGKIAPTVDWVDIVRENVHEVWIDEIEKASEIPNRINVGAIDELIGNYRHNIIDKYEKTAKWLSAKLIRLTYTPANLPLLRKLKGHVSKKRNIPSIRKLNDEMLQHGYHKITTPCWLVSPETVSDVFPLVNGLFDIVIFDEASQCPVKNALPAVFRGKKVFVAGDEKQLPPLTLFESSHQDGSEDEDRKDVDALDAQSFLNLANRLPQYRESPLSWHYRSEYEELIAFSNHAFYNGLMRTCPNCRPYDAESAPAISWVKTKGYWVDRANEIEADQVVELIRSHLAVRQEESIGVITFNAEQKNLILTKLDNMCQIDSIFKDLILENASNKLDEQLFVKNIENVQGDERDVIIFSVAYAPSEPGGKVIQQFGLLNQDGGENRLNVAISRAKKHIHVVCSIDPEVDLNPVNSKFLGPKRFQQYLIYAKAVAERNQNRMLSLFSELNPSMKISTPSTSLVFESPFEEEVYHSLRQNGFVVHSQVGQSGFRIDLSIVDPKDPSRYILGIECDGARYHASQSARERDVFRQKFLERRGWKIYRVWSTRWWRDKNRELQRISDYINSLQN
jgi:very-short-patch-repair endonuclease